MSERRKPAKNGVAVVEFRTSKPGPALLFLGAIHGDEICGTRAMRRIIEEIRAGKITLQKGNVTFVPVCNPLAHARNVRFVKENLNRIFRPTKNPRSPEARFANILCRLVDRCDAMIDLHSITARGDAFIYLDYPSRKTRALARILGPKTAILGWPQLYKKLGRAHPSFDTTTWAAKRGKDGLLMECGQHEAPASVTAAHNAILNTLRYYGIIKGAVKHRRFTEIKMCAAFFRQRAGDRLAKNWKHLDRVKKSDNLILNADGSVIKAPYDAFVIMPKSTARVGDDWLYLGKS